MANQNDTHDHNLGSNEPVPDGIRWFKEHSIAIAGVIAVLLIICFVQHYSTRTINWTKTNDFTNAFRNVTQGLAFIAGGIWAYFKFRKGRTFQESLVPLVSGRFAFIDGAAYLVVTTEVKNVGLSKIEFDKVGCALIVFEYTPKTLPEIHTVTDKRLTSFDVFDENDRRIEPNEVITQQILVAIPGSVQLAYRLKLRILSLSGYIWGATTIVDKSRLSDNAAGEQVLGSAENTLR